MELLSEVRYLETSRLNLRPFLLKDAQTVFEYASDPHVVQFLTFEVHRTRKESRELIRSSLMKPGFYLIEKKENHQGIGAINLLVDEPNQKATFGYAFVRSQWGKGYATEALYAILKLAFEYLYLNRVEAIYAVDNPASGAVMKKCGMVYEGTFRQSERWNGRFFDVIQMAILSSDWKVHLTNHHSAK